MSLRVNCPSCKAAFVLDEALRGKKVRCKKCEGIFTVRPEEDDADDSRRPDRRVASGPAPARRPRDEDEREERRPVRGRDEDDEDDRARKPARGRRDEDEDERPRRGRGRDEEYVDDRPRSEDRKKAGGSWLPLILGGGLLVLLLSAGGVWWAMGGLGTPNRPDNPGDAKKEPKALPATLAADDLARVKKATVQLQVALPGGGKGEGTGFFAVEPGVIITNAHVLGMLSPDSLQPTSVNVIVHSGEAAQFTVKGVVLGVDRANDLAVLRADAAAAPLPPPLEVDTSDALIETQKMYVFGFPFGTRLGKDITVTESSITSLRKKEGALNQVQLKGGMNPGNSGGPVTDTRGVVVGVSVSIIKGTELSFAIPGDYVRRILAGGIAEQEFGTPFSAGGQQQVPVLLTRLDPLNRMKEVKVEVWTGPAGDPLPAGEKEPARRPGDGERRGVPAAAKGTGFAADVPLPPLPAGHVYWAQVVTTSAGSPPRWAAARAVPYDPNTVIERKPANLAFKAPAGPVERTVRITSDKTVNAHVLGETKKARFKIDGHALEALSVDTRGLGTGVRLLLNRPRFTLEEDGVAVDAPPTIAQYVNRFSPSYLLTANHSVKEFGRPTNLVGVPPEFQKIVQGLFDAVCNTYEVTTIPLPNRVLQPGDTWPANVPMLITTGQERRVPVRIGRQTFWRTVPARKEALALNLTCTYEGSRETGGVPFAHVRLAGVVNGVGPKAAEVYGKVTGQAVVNLASGMLARVKTTITTEMAPAEDVRLLMTDESTIDRVEGNTQGIRPPAPPQPPPPPPPSSGGPFSNLYTRVITGDVDEYTAKAIKEKRLAALTVSGNTSGRHYRETATAGLLVGFEVSQGLFGTSKVVHGLRAIYRTKDGEKLGAWQGKAPPAPGGVVTLKAKPGYVVSGVNFRAGLTLDGISLTFRKLDRGQLDEKDSYTSDWAGNNTGGKPYSAGTPGHFFVGYAGHLNGENQACSFGLITLLPPKEGAPAVALGDLKVTQLKLSARDLVPSLVFSPDGKSLYAVEQNGTLHKLDASTFSTTLKENLGAKCAWLAMSKEGLVATMKESNEAWVIDPNTLKTLRKVPVPSLERVAAVPTSSVAVAATRDEAQVLDLKEGKKLASTRLRLYHVTLGPDGKTCYAQSGVEQLTAFSVSPTGLTQTAQSPRIASNGQGVTVSADGKHVCLPAGGGNGGKPYTTYVFSTGDLSKPAFIIEGGAYPRAVGFDIKAPLAYAMNHNTQLMIYSFDGKKQKECLLPGGGETRSFTPHPEGRRVLVLTGNALCDVKLPEK